jgi:hypothetical protein
MVDSAVLVADPSGLRQSFVELLANGFGLGPLARLCALAEAVSVDLAADPFGTVTPAAGAILRKFAASRVAGKDGKQHRAPTSSGEIARCLGLGQKGATYKSRTKLRAHLPLEDKLLRISNLKLVEAAGVEPVSGTENTQVTDIENA